MLCALCKREERMLKKHLCRTCGDMIVRLLYAVERITVEMMTTPRKVEETKLERAQRVWGGVA